MDKTELTVKILKEKEELDELDERIKSAKSSVEELKDTIIRYNELDQILKDLTRIRKVYWERLELLRSFAYETQLLEK